MVDIVSKNGERLARIADSLDVEDTIYVDGQEVHLSDAYNDENIIKKFNTQVKENKDASKSKD